MLLADSKVRTSIAGRRKVQCTFHPQLTLKPRVHEVSPLLGEGVSLTLSALSLLQLLHSSPGGSLDIKE
jgi:hypothetical protein